MLTNNSILVCILFSDDNLGIGYLSLCFGTLLRLALRKYHWLFFFYHTNLAPHILSHPLASPLILHMAAVNSSAGFNSCRNECFFTSGYCLLLSVVGLLQCHGTLRVAPLAHTHMHSQSGWELTSSGATSTNVGWELRVNATLNHPQVDNSRKIL